MWIYIVSWYVITLIPVPCPDANIPDKFGRSDQTSICSVFHTDTKYEYKEQMFFNRDSAFIFYKEAKNGESEFLTIFVTLGSVKIDSIYQTGR